MPEEKCLIVRAAGRPATAAVSWLAIERPAARLKQREEEAVAPGRG